jgi:hypothetical protein
MSVAPRGGAVKRPENKVMTYVRPVVAAFPEAWRLGQVNWQFFVTLTFRADPPCSSSRRKLLFSWLRDVAEAPPQIYFKRLLWVARYELGRNSRRGHYHLCVAGKGRDTVTVASCMSLEAAWRQHTGARSEVRPYDHGRDGVGYVLKLPAQSGTGPSWAGVKINDGDDQEPTLSKSLFSALRRGRM